MDGCKPARPPRFRRGVREERLLTGGYGPKLHLCAGQSSISNRMWRCSANWRYSIKLRAIASDKDILGFGR